MAWGWIHSPMRSARSASPFSRTRCACGQRGDFGSLREILLNSSHHLKKGLPTPESACAGQLEWEGHSACFDWAAEEYPNPHDRPCSLARASWCLNPRCHKPVPCYTECCWLSSGLAEFLGDTSPLVLPALLLVSIVHHCTQNLETTTRELVSPST